MTMAVTANRATGCWSSLIGDRWVGGEQRLPVEDPGSGEIIGEVALADRATVDAAIRAAHDCHRRRALTAPRPAERLALMFRIADEIRRVTDEGAELLCRESGKPLADARGEFEEAARYFEYYGGMADKIEGRSIPLGDDYVDWTVREPHGVSAQIVPWNFPVGIAARSLAPALATGNAVVMKSPELAPAAMTLLAHACREAGAPDGAVNLVCGYGEEAGAALVGHPLVDQIVFTGSIPTGRAIGHAAAERIVPCVLELGGKSAAIVHADADLDTVLTSVRSGIFFNAGQVCSAMARVLVHESIHDELLERTVELAEGLHVGHGLEPDTELTPLISAGQLERVTHMCQAGLAEGARAATGGERIDRPGHFMQPTVFTDVRPDMSIARDEIFGPAISLMKFRDTAEAVEIANGTDYGLVAGVFTRDLDHALRTAQQLIAGQVFVNEWFAGGVETPFGGIARSGHGREKGLEALDNYLRTRNIAIRLGR